MVWRKIWLGQKQNKNKQKAVYECLVLWELKDISRCVLCSDEVPGVPSAVSCLYRMALQLCKGGKVKNKDTTG